METTSDQKSWNLVWKLMLLFHILFTMAITAMAVAIQMWISALQVPSFDRVAPEYLKPVTTSRG